MIGSTQPHRPSMDKTYTATAHPSTRGLLQWIIRLSSCRVTKSVKSFDSQAYFMMKLLETDNACSKTSWVTTHTLRQQCSSGCSVAPLVVLNTAKLWIDGDVFRTLVQQGCESWSACSLYCWWEPEFCHLGETFWFPTDASHCLASGAEDSPYSLEHVGFSAMGHPFWISQKREPSPISIYHCGHCHKQNQ